MYILFTLFYSFCRIAVVTGANKGIGIEICKQLLERGVKVVLTARDENRGQMAVKKLQQLGAKNIEFHQVDIADSPSIASLKEFIKSQFGRLDILINNAGVAGVEIKREPGVIIEFIPSESIKNEIRNINDLTTERLEELLASFMDDFKAGTYIEKGWPKSGSAPAYKLVSKVGVCAYTRILAKNYPKICTNCVHPGYVKTDINFNTGNVTVEEGASGPVMLDY